MDFQARSADGIDLFYEMTGQGRATLLFVHGWLGSAAWWADQCAFFAGSYRVLAMDLAGHGRSGRGRRSWSAEAYARDIVAVIEHSAAENVIIVGHSMAGAYALEAALLCPRVRALVPVDTLKDLDKLLTPEQAEEFLLRHYRTDFPAAIRDLIPRFLFSPATPPEVRERLAREFACIDGVTAAELLAPLYQQDVRALAREVAVPVRAIVADFAPVNPETNRRYLRDYDLVVMKDCGHYPMLEQPKEFNRVLGRVLKELGY